MSDKITLQNVASIDNSLINAINNNNATLISAIDNTLSRDGTSPNQMTNTLDMNGKPIINIPFASTPNQPVALGQLNVAQGNLPLAFPTLAGDVTGTFSTTTGIMQSTLQPLSGDVSTPSGRVVTLNTVNSNVGTFGAANAIPVVTANAKGLTTAVTTVAPNPVVVNSVSYPASPGTNTVPVVTGTNTVTYEQVPGAAIANNAISNSQMTTMANQTIKSNISGGTANPSDNTLTAIIDNAFGSTQGDILYRGASNWTVLTPGTNGQALLTGGPSANISWGSASGNLVLLNTLTASNSATLADTTSLTSTYKTYMIIFSNIIPVTNAVQFFAQVSTNGGSSYLTTSYVNSLFTFTSGATNTASLASGIPFSNTGAPLSNSAGYGLDGVIYVHNPSGGTTRTFFSGNTTYSNSTTIAPGSLISGWQDTGTTAVNAIQFLMSSGNISSGVIKIYGIT